jgi:hypothetical protein
MIIQVSPRWQDLDSRNDRAARPWPVVFDSIVSKIANIVRAVGAAARRSPWLTSIAILALFMVL